MMFLHKTMTLYLMIVISIVSSFTPDTSSFDAYGLKLAANDILLVESLPSQQAFFLRLSPFNYSLSCTIAYNDSNQYIYAVALNSPATYNDTIRFVFIGVNMKTDVPFIGSLTYTGVTGPAYVVTLKSPRRGIFPCNGWQPSNYRLHQFEQFISVDADNNGNNDFFVVTVAPTGQFAYAFTESFLLVYDLDQDIVSNQLGNITWPDTSFLPHAVDVSSDSLFVVLGYVGDSSTYYTPCAYLLNISNSIFNVLDSWSYTPPTSTSWQAQLTNWDADSYAPKYDMSVSINNVGDQVLLGIQTVNTIVLVDVDRINQKFGLSFQTLSNGKAIGMGKTVGWFDTHIILVLVNNYSFSYIWSSSQIFAYNVTIPNSFDIIWIFPNIQQTLTAIFGPILLSIVVTQNGIAAMLDSDGNYYILLPLPPGSFPDSSTGTSSSSLSCIAGTFKSQLDIFSCSLCPLGTTTAGLIGQSSCVPCENDTFCPLGSAFGDFNMSSSLLTNVNQVRAYPVSPQSVRFDNILIANMFEIHGSSSNHCLLVSPLFWTILVISFGIFIWIIMFVFKRYGTHPEGKRTHQKIKRFLKKIDLIGEGEMVIGGLFSFSVLVLVAFGYRFSNLYYHRYPIEQVKGNASFACDPTLTNAQFSTGLMSIGIPPSDDEAPIFALLDAQPFILNIGFANTVFNCTDVSVTQIKDIIIPMTISSCYNDKSSVSLSLILPSHDISLQIQLTGTNTIGGVRIGLEGGVVALENNTLSDAYTLINLTFAQALSVSDRLLTQQPSCAIQITKVINRTYPLATEGESQFNGVWFPTLSGNLDQMFVDENEYRYATSSSTIFSIVISQTSYYVLNTQWPITDEEELIFTDLLFTIVCLEIFALGLLIFELIIIPLIKWIFGYCCRRRTSTKRSSENDFELPEIFTTRL